MKRRDFLASLAVIGSSVASARMSIAQAQRKKMRVGIATIQPRTGPLWRAFEQRLKQIGYTEGDNLAVEFIDLNGPMRNESEATTRFTSYRELGTAGRQYHGRVFPAS